MRDFLRRRLGLVLAVVVVVLLLSATRLAAFFTDLWWFEELGYRSVFTTILVTKIGLGVVFGLALAVIIGANLFIARRLRPFFLPRNEREAIIERYRQMVDPYVPWIIVGVSLVFAFSAGGAVATQWNRYLLWSNGGPFGIADPQFDRDVGFYVFDLPWLSFLQGWLFTSLLLALIITAIAHYLFGSIRPEQPSDRVTPRAKAHLSVLLALVLAARAWGYWLDRFELNFSPRGQVTGASYTDVHAELPALTLLLVVSAVAIVLVLWNIRSRGWLLPGAAIGLLILASILLQGIYPAAIQRLRVDPQELAREREFIGRNLEMTRTAYGIDLDELDTTRFEVRDDLGEEDVAANQVTLNNVRLWDTGTLNTTYKQLQAIRLYYEFADVDVDRYEIDGEVRQVMLSARELFPQGLEPGAQTWQNLHLTFTHGHGAVASQVNTVTRQGQPVFLARDIPPRGPAETLIAEEPAIYYGEAHDDYSVVRTDQPELDFEDSDTGEQVVTNYEGEGGVPMGTLSRRLAFALRMRDPNLLISGLIRPDSKILFHRLIDERVRQVAPFLELDDDPYPVVLDHKIVWVQDAYTTSSHYPYSERATWKGGQSVNYVRNSVKAVVDAFDGTVTLYVVDPDDPVLAAWRRAFPEPFAPLDEAPAGLREHFRYPQDMFELQALIFRTYHIPGPDAFYSKADEWAIPPDAAAIENGEDPSTPLRPYYLLMRLPGQENEEFVLIQPYLARNKPNMIAWLAGRSDPEQYGKLFSVQFPSDQTILGTAQAQARIEQDPTISEFITLRSQAGSDVRRGNLLVIPIERSILYVEPLFIENPQARIPELAKVTIVMGDEVVMADTLEEALEDLLGRAPPGAGPPEGEEQEEEEDAFDEDDVIEEILELFREAEEALRNGDLAGYQRALDRAEVLLERLAEERGIALPAPEEEQQPPPEGQPTPAPSPTG